MSSVSSIPDSSAPAGPTRSARLSAEFRQWLARLRALSGLILAALVLWIGWSGREGRNLSAAEGLGYWLGIIGGTLMIALLLYSVRKRIPWLRHLGATRHWFKMHMTLGIVGPVIILYHSNFQVGSINSQVALYCTLLVAASGIVGRYFYAQIHNGLYGSSMSLRQLLNTVEVSGDQPGGGHALDPAVRQQLAALAEAVLQRPASLGSSALTPVWFGFKTRWLNWRLRRAAYQHIDTLADSSAVIEEQRPRLRKTTRRYIGRRLAEIRRVAQFRFFEKLFSLWHVVHVPFFLMMVLSAVAHVIAVHMY